VKRNLDQFLSGLDLLPYLILHPAILVTWAAHPTLIAQIGTSLWQSEALIKADDGRLLFTDPASHFDIHFEIQVFQWEGKMALYLHYETNPYYSQAKLRAKVDEESLERYFERREQFIDEFERQCQVPGFKVSRSVVQIGKAQYEFRGKTSAEVSAWLTPIIDEVACAVNDTLDKVNLRAVPEPQFSMEQDVLLPHTDHEAVVGGVDDENTNATEDAQVLTINSESITSAVSAER
jgi:hypothetical protein